MSAIIYNKAFSVELSHNFYETANRFRVNNDFEIVPTEECARLLVNGKMRFIRNQKGFFVYYQSRIDGNNIEQPLVRLDDGVEFTFALRMSNNAMPFLLNVSDFNVNAQTYDIQKLFLLEGDDSALPPPPLASLDASLVNMLRPAVFTYNFKSGTAYTGNSDVIVFSGATEILRVNNVPFNPDSQTYSVGIDITGSPKGYYTLVAYQSAPVPVAVIHSTDFYNDGSLSKQNVFGAIKIKFAIADNLYMADSANPNDHLAYEYTFANRSVKWRYIVAVKRPGNYFTSGKLLEVLDTTTPLPVYTFAVLDGQPSSSYNLNGANTVIFTSNVAIAFKETIIKKFALNQLVVDPKTLIASLANANPTGVDSNCAGSAGGPFAEIFVVLDNGDDT